MTRIKLAHIVWGGLLAGVVINTSEFVVNFFVLGDEWINSPAESTEVEDSSESDSQTVMTGGQIAALNLWGFLVGLTALWLYASIRPRYGPGPKTAMFAGTAVWALASLLPAVRPTIGEGFSTDAIVISVVMGLAAINLGTMLGAWQYREDEAGVTDGGASES